MMDSKKLNDKESGFVSVTLSFGANHGECASILRESSDIVSGWLINYRCSDFYETPAIGNHAVGTYLNAVAEGMTTLSYDELELRLKSLEINAGRDGLARERGEVPLDIDVVIFDGQIIRPWDYAQSFFLKGYRQLNPQVD